MLPSAGGGEHAGHVQRSEAVILGPLFVLQYLEGFEVFDGVVDAGGGQHGIELTPVGGGIVLGQDGLDDLGLGQAFTRLGRLLAFGLKEVDVEF